MASRRVFVSCASADYRNLRAELSAYLRRADCDVKVQEDFCQAPESTLDKLDGCIRSCAAVLHLMGVQAGSPAGSIQVREYLAREKAFLANHPELREALGDASGLSYTQWEALMALHHEVPLFVYAAEGLAFEEKQRRHQGHLQLSRTVRHVETFRGEKDLFGKLIGDLRHIIPSIVPAETKPCNVPQPSLHRLFKGREKELDKLHALVAARNRKPVVLHGMGGVGKTRLAMEYGYRRKEHLAALLFLEADSKVSLYRNLADLAKPDILDLPAYKQPDEGARRRAVLKWLERHPDWLVILDNVDTSEAAAAVEDFLAQFPPGGHVLVTSRLRVWSANLATMELDILDPEPAFSFLKERTEGRRVVEPGEDRAFRELVRELDGLALALEQAGAYIVNEEITASEYLRKFQDEKPTTLAWCHAQTMRYPHSVAATLKISIDRIGAESRHLLQILAYFAPTPIPSVLFPGWKEALRELRNFSLTQRAFDLKNAFIVHCLVQEVMRHRVVAEGMAATRQKEALAFLVGEDPGRVEFNAWVGWEALLTPHLREMLGVEETSSLVSLPMARILSGLTLFLTNRLGPWKMGASLYRRALKTFNRVLGPEHPETLVTVDRLARLLEYMDAYAEAKSLYRRALDTRDRTLGPEHPDTLVTVDKLANLLGCMKAYAEAESLYRRALDTRERILGPEHPDTLISVQDLANLLGRKGAYAEAELLCRRALEARERVLCSEHPYTLLSVHNLAQLLERKGAYAEAEPICRRALEALDRIFGPGNPFALDSAHVLARLLERKGAYAESEAVYRRVLDGWNQLAGPEHPIALACVHDLARLVERAGGPSGSVTAFPPGFE